MLSRKMNERLYVAIISSTLTYGCEAWTMTKITEKKLRTSENSVWSIMCGPSFDEAKGNWQTLPTKSCT